MAYGELSYTVHMKKLLPLLLVFGLVTIAFAHETTREGTVAMFVHIDPNEQPVVGVPATVFINLTNTEKSFAVKDCSCTLVIAHDDTVLMAVPLEPSDDPEAFGIAGVPVIFVTPGSYDLTVSGTPKVAGLFNPFTIDEDITVVSDGTLGTKSDHHQHGSSVIHFLHFALLWGGIGASTVVIYRERKELFKKK